MATGQGILSLDLVQIEGGRAVSGYDFVNGHQNIIGSQLESPKSDSDKDL